MPTYTDYRKVYLTQDEAQNLTIGLIVGLVVAMAFNMAEPEVAFLVALCVLMLAEVLTLNEVLAGFANDSLITIASLFLVIGAIEKSHIVAYGARKAFGMNSTPFWGKLRMYVSSFFISAWFNNIPQVAIMVPIVQDWSKLRKIPSSQLLIPLSYSVLAGGMLCTIGTSTNLTVNGLMTNAGLEPFNFFDPAVIGLPAGVALIIYMMVIGPYLLPHNEDKVSTEHERGYSHVAELQIHGDSFYINKPVRNLFENLGLLADNLVKIRRVKGAFKEDEGKNDDEGIEEGKKGTYRSIPLTEFTASERADSTRVVNLPEAFVDPYKQFEQRTAEFLPFFYRLQPGFDVPKRENYQSVDQYEDLHPDTETIVQPGDILFIANAQVVAHTLLKTMFWENQGITILGDVKITEIPVYGDRVVELVVSKSNVFLNKVIHDVGNDFAARFQCAILSAKQITDYESDNAKLFKRSATCDVTLEQGSSILAIVGEHAYDKLALSDEFISVQKVYELDAPATLWSLFTLPVFLTMVSLVAANQVDICAVSLSMAAFFFVGGWLEPKDIERFTEIRILMLLGASLSFATGMTKSGLAATLATKIAAALHNPTNSLYLIYLVTLFITEVISNNAAAALLFPISVNIAKELGVSYKPFAMVVMNAASMAFMCPIGYATHIMVWRPGKYTFMDFAKFGLIPNILWMVLTCLIAPAVWKF
eukprot:gene16308-22215_t